MRTSCACVSPLVRSCKSVRARDTSRARTRKHGIRYQCSPSRCADRRTLANYPPRYNHAITNLKLCAAFQSVPTPDESLLARFSISCLKLCSCSVNEIKLYMFARRTAPLVPVFGSFLASYRARFASETSILRIQVVRRPVQLKMLPQNAHIWCA